jgi:succinyl-CoA synthetase beta subunit
MVEEIPEIEELDINPLVITADRGLVAIDARVIAG